MSKIVPIAALPLIVAAAPIVAVGAAATWVAGKAREKWNSLSPEDRTYLFPFGADPDRLQLEEATVPYEPLEGIEFNEPLPVTRGISQDKQHLLTFSEVKTQQTMPVQEEALNFVAAKANSAGFKTERRVLPPGTNILIVDLFQPTLPPELEPVLVGGSNDSEKN